MTLRDPEGTGRVECAGLLPRRWDRATSSFRPALHRICNTGASDLIFLAICTPRFTPDAYGDVEPDTP
jgi:hypothetical protein